MEAPGPWPLWPMPKSGPVLSARSVIGGINCPYCSPIKLLGAHAACLPKFMSTFALTEKNDRFNLGILGILAAYLHIIEIWRQ